MDKPLIESADVDEKVAHECGVVHVPGLQVPRRTSPSRIIRDGHVDMGKRRGARLFLGDAYFYLLSRPWWQLIVILLLSYLLSSLFFAVLFLVVPGELVNEEGEVEKFWDIFVFAASIMADLEPTAEPVGTLQVIYLFEGVFQLVALAIMVGVVVDRITHPTARVEFSKKAVIAPYDGHLAFMFRAANERDSAILEADFRLFVVVSYKTLEGHVGRRAHELALARHHMPFFHLSFSLCHIIDEDSPLHGVTAKQMIDDRMELFVLFTGVESTHGEEVRLFHSYVCEDIVVGGVFEDILQHTDDGDILMDLDHLNSIKGGDSKWTGPIFDPKIAAEKRWNDIRSKIVSGRLVAKETPMEEEEDTTSDDEDDASAVETISVEEELDEAFAALPDTVRNMLRRQKQRLWKNAAQSSEARMCQDLSVLGHEDHHNHHHHHDHADTTHAPHMGDRRPSVRRRSSMRRASRRTSAFSTSVNS